MNTPTPKDAELAFNLPASRRLTGWQQRRADEQASLAHLRAVQATWPPLGEAHERRMEECRERLAEGGEARDRAARMLLEARAKAPRKDGEE